MEKFELCIDHPMLQRAKEGFNACLKTMVSRAISTGSMEGTANLKISFEINEAIDEETGESYRTPLIDYKAGYSVPIKNGCDGKIIEHSRILQNGKGGYILVNGQISMDELMQGDEK